MTFKEAWYQGGAKTQGHGNGLTQTLKMGPSATHPLNPYPRVHRYFLYGSGPPGKAKFILPDARGIRKGWPVLVFIVEGEAGSEGFRIENSDASLVLEWEYADLPFTVTMGLADNTTEAGTWVWCSKSTTVVEPPPISYVGSFGTGGDLSSQVNKYDPAGNVWAADANLTGSVYWRLCGTSWDVPRSLIRVGTEIYSYYLSTTTTENLSGSAVAEQVAFCRVPPPSGNVTTFQRDHVCFGTNAGGSFSNIIDRYRSDTNVVYLGTTPSWIDWDVCTASGSSDRGPVGCLVSAHGGTPAPGYGIQTPFFFYAPLADTSVKVLDLPTANWYLGHMVELLGEHHHVGGATRVKTGTNTFATNPTAYHHRIDMTTASAWVTLPALAGPVYSHGCMGFSATEVRSRAYYGMGIDPDNEAFVNPRTFYYDKYTQVSVVARTDSWAVRHIQNNHWSRMG